MLFIAAAVVAADQLTKLAIVRTLHPGESRPVIDHVVWLTYVRNPGAAFGMLRGVPGVLLLAGIAAAVSFAYVISRKPDVLTGTAAALVAGGAIGNLCDRVFKPWPFHGTVVDFVDLHWWPAFNVADSAISIGAVLLILASLRREKPDTGV